MKSCLQLLLLAGLSSCLSYRKPVPPPQPSRGAVPFSSVFDFRAQRLSGSRVQLTWHAQPGKQQLNFKIVRKIGRDGRFDPIAEIRSMPGSEQVISDFAHTDLNQHSDSSYYAILQVDGSGAKYYSVLQGVGGTGK